MRAAFGGQPSSADYHAPGEATRYYTVSFGPLHLAGNRSRFLLASFDDVSDRQAIARMRSDFVANASHELRTPLASLTGFIETLLGPARNDPKATEKFLGIMLDQARRMRRLIDDLLLLSRAEMRVHSRPTERVDLLAPLRQVADAVAPLAAEQGVEVVLDVPDQPVVVVGDHDQLLQVFQNLAENGIRYGAAGKRVEVTLELRPNGRPGHGPCAGLRPGHSARAFAAFDGALLPRRCRRQPGDEGNRTWAGDRQAHPDPPRWRPGSTEPGGRGRTVHGRAAASRGDHLTARPTQKRRGKPRQFVTPVLGRLGQA
jgi:signal transduction histidine kinase